MTNKWGVKIILLAYTHAHGGRFTGQAYQELVGVDIYTASADDVYAIFG